MLGPWVLPKRAWGSNSKGQPIEWSNPIPYKPNFVPYFVNVGLLFTYTHLHPQQHK